MTDDKKQYNDADIERMFKLSEILSDLSDDETSEDDEEEKKEVKTFVPNCYRVVHKFSNGEILDTPVDLDFHIKLLMMNEDQFSNIEIEDQLYRDYLVLQRQKIVK